MASMYYNNVYYTEMSKEIFMNKKDNGMVTAKVRASAYAKIEYNRIHKYS